ncbi:MAG: hypothetical protein NC200_02965 [Candidatus Gastranaerophilales bacterium]|nr:hypothetical protein [Candidatus Gastranaerophilales bacterium]
MISAINNYNIQNRNSQVTFTAKNPTKISKATIDRFGLNMKTRIGYDGPKDYMPAPDSIKPSLREFLHKLEINWNTHIESTKK